LEREKVAKGQEGLEKLINTLQATDGLNLPEWGLSRIDLAKLQLGKIEPA
jgi:hypothetical protein